MKTRRFGLIASGVLVAVLAGCGIFGGSDYPSVYHDSKERQQYQLALNHAADRVAGNVPSVKDGHVYIARPLDTWPCSFQCATASWSGNGYSVSLPVGYTYQVGRGQLIDDERFQIVPITTLTFWNPITHKSQTITAAKGTSVALPDELRYRNVKSLRVGESGFVRITDIIETKNEGVVIYDFGQVTPEPGGELYANDPIFNVPIVRTDGGLVICLVEGRYPVIYTDQPSKTRSTLPVRMTTECQEEVH